MLAAGRHACLLQWCAAGADTHGLSAGTRIWRRRTSGKSVWCAPVLLAAGRHACLPGCNGVPRVLTHMTCLQELESGEGGLWVSVCGVPLCCSQRAGTRACCKWCATGADTHDLSAGARRHRGRTSGKSVWCAPVLLAAGRHGCLLQWCAAGADTHDLSAGTQIWRRRTSGKSVCGAPVLLAAGRHACLLQWCAAGADTHDLSAGSRIWRRQTSGKSVLCAPVLLASGQARVLPAMVCRGC